MRARLVLAVMLLGCADRTVEPPVDYSEEVERICEGFCAMDIACLDEPLVTVEECIEVCEQPDTVMFEESACGDAFRAYYGCVASTQTCDVWASNECDDERETMFDLKCGTTEGD